MRSYLASRTSAIIPAASGAADDVPLNTPVHLWCRSVVTCQRIRRGHVNCDCMTSDPKSDVSVGKTVFIT